MRLNQNWAWNYAVPSGLHHARLLSFAQAVALLCFETSRMKIDQTHLETFVALTGVLGTVFYRMKFLRTVKHYANSEQTTIGFVLHPVRARAAVFRDACFACCFDVYAESTIARSSYERTFLSHRKRVYDGYKYGALSSAWEKECGAPIQPASAFVISERLGTVPEVALHEPVLSLACLDIHLAACYTTIAHHKHTSSDKSSEITVICLTCG